MKITIETIFALVSAVGVVGGIIAWWLGRILDDRKDSIQQAMKINYLEKEMEEDFYQIKCYKSNYFSQIGMKSRQKIESDGLNRGKTVLKG